MDRFKILPLYTSYTQTEPSDNHWFPRPPLETYQRAMAAAEACRKVVGNPALEGGVPVAKGAFGCPMNHASRK